MLDMNRKPRYKAIKRSTRTSAMLHGNSKYARKYVAGTSVYAMEGTLGIFVFKHKTYAQEWVDVWNRGAYRGEDIDLIVVPVIPIGRGRTLVWISGSLQSSDLDEYYDDNDDDWILSEAPDDTMGYPGVHVLE